MPTEPFTGAEIDDSRTLLQLLMLLDRSGANDDEIEEALLLFAAEPLQRSLKQDIGPEHLSIARLQREAAARGCDEDDASVTTYITYGYRLEWLPAVVAALDPPDEIETDGEHVFTGEEAVLLLLRRYRSTGPLRAMTWETGRSISAISEAVWYMVEHIHSRFPHLCDERAFTSWAPHFHEFADAFEENGIPIPNLIGFIDGKLWPLCRPGRFQHILYSGHKRIHGLKTQGIVFPNGICPYLFGPVNGARHDSTLLRGSRILQILHDVCRGGPLARHGPHYGGLGVDYRLFGDSAYPISTFLWRMYKGVMQPWQRAFNRDMSSERIAAEWGFGKMVQLWPFLDYRKKHKVLLAPVGRHFAVGNILTNIHTILSGGNIISLRYGLSPHALDAYMAGGPY